MIDRRFLSSSIGEHHLNTHSLHSSRNIRPQIKSESDSEGDRFRDQVRVAVGAAKEAPTELALEGPTGVLADPRSNVQSTIAKASQNHEGLEIVHCQTTDICALLSAVLVLKIATLTHSVINANA